jgi:hypothetical protein
MDDELLVSPAVRQKTLRLSASSYHKFMRGWLALLPSFGVIV